MKRTTILRYVIVIFCFTNLYGQTTIEKGLRSITSDAIKAQVGFLSSDWTEGRKTGEKGEYLAGDYIASMLQLYGVKPGGDIPVSRERSAKVSNREKTFFQNFLLLKTTPGEEQVLQVRSGSGTSYTSVSLANNIDFTIRPADTGIETESPVIFIGYGYRNEKLNYDDFAKIDIRGKFLLKLAGIPGFAKKQLSDSELSLSSGDAENIAREKGAAGIIEIFPDIKVAGFRLGNRIPDLAPSENRQVYPRDFSDYSLPDERNPDKFLKISITLSAANQIMEGSGNSIEEYISESAIKPVSPDPAIKGKSLYVQTIVKTEIVRTRNIIGIVEGANPDEVIVLGAHYDHIGTANGYIWNGADDNASGTVGVLTLAKAIMETGVKPAKTLVFALWSAEEEGLLGSRYFVKNPIVPLKNIKLNFNFDMISRYINDNEPNKVSMIYTESYDPMFRTLTGENLKRFGIDLEVDYQPSKDPPGGSDHRSFVAEGIPILRFKPGHREQYHTPGDEAAGLNWDIMEKIVKISFADLWELANSDW